MEPMRTSDTNRNIQAYLEMVVETNKVMNLTAIKDPAEMKVKHVEDSLTLCPLLEEFQPKHLLDMGTGAGFPGMLLKICYPELFVTLVDSLRKRIDFLQSVQKNLQLNHLECIHARAEDLAKTDHRESYDFVVARAVARLNTLSELCLPFVRIGGIFVAMKGPDGEEEIQEAKKAISILGGSLLRKETLQLSDGSDRQLILIRKEKPSPKKYPRGQNKPKTKPL